MSAPNAANVMGSMTVMARGEELRIFEVNSTATCMRLCELSEDCKSISTSHSTTTSTTTASGSRICTHGSESQSKQAFDTVVTFSVNRPRSLSEVVHHDRASGRARTWTRHVSNGLVDFTTGEPSLVAS